MNDSSASPLTWLLTGRTDQLDADDLAFGVEVGNEHFAASGLIRQFAAMLGLFVDESYVADLFRNLQLLTLP